MLLHEENLLLFWIPFWVVKRREGLNTCSLRLLELLNHPFRVVSEWCTPTSIGLFFVLPFVKLTPWVVIAVLLNYRCVDFMDLLKLISQISSEPGFTRAWDTSDCDIDSFVRWHHFGKLSRYISSLRTLLNLNLVIYKSSVFEELIFPCDTKLWGNLFLFIISEIHI